MFRINVIPHNQLIRAWPLVEKYYKDLVEDNPDELTLQGIQGRLLAQNEYLAFILDNNNEITGTFTYGFLPMDTGKRALAVPLLAGENAPEWMADFGTQLADIARHNNCYEVQFRGCRRGWARMIKTNTPGAPACTEDYTLKFEIKENEI